MFHLTRLFSFHASGNFGLCFSLDTKTCISSKVGWFPTSVWKAIWYSGTDSPVRKRKNENKTHIYICILKKRQGKSFQVMKDSIKIAVYQDIVTPPSNPALLSPKNLN